MNTEYIYTIFWQKRNNAANEKTEQEIFSDLVKFITGELEQAKTIFEKSNAEYLQKQMLLLRSGLSQYLSTVLQSDSSDINNIILEALHSIDIFENTPKLFSTSSLLIDASDIPMLKKKSSMVKTLLQKGKKELAGKGISFSKNQSNIFTTKFLVSNLDSFEFLMNVIASIRQKNEAENFLPVYSSASKIARKFESENNSQHFSVHCIFASSTNISAIQESVQSCITEFELSGVRLQLTNPFSITDQKIEFVFSVDLNTHSIIDIFTALNLINDKETAVESLFIFHDAV